MSENNKNQLDNIFIQKTLINQKNKDLIISKLNLELKNLSKEINRLEKENSDLKIKYSLSHEAQLRLQEAEETIKDLNEKNLKLMLDKKKRESELQKNINEILLEIKKEKLNFEKNEILSMQKLQNAKQIELENEIYKKEVEKLKKQIETIDLDSKSKINELEMSNLIKYNILKKKNFGKFK